MHCTICKTPKLCNVFPWLVHIHLAKGCLTCTHNWQIRSSISFKLCACSHEGTFKIAFLHKNVVFLRRKKRKKEVQYIFSSKWIGAIEMYWWLEKCRLWLICDGGVRLCLPHNFFCKRNFLCEKALLLKVHPRQSCSMWLTCLYMTGPLIVVTTILALQIASCTVSNHAGT